MGFAVEFDATNEILRIAFEGQLTDAVAVACSETVSKCVTSLPPCSSIVDLSQVTKYEVSPQAMRQFARAAPSSSPAARTLVIVAPKESAFGMSRMFQLLTENTIPNQHVVRTMEEAYKLLHVKIPEFRPLSEAKTE